MTFSKNFTCCSTNRKSYPAILLALIALFVLTSCAGLLEAPTGEEGITSVEQHDFDQATDSFDNDRNKEALKRYERFVNDHPQSILVEHALLQIGILRYRSGQLEQSYDSFKRLIDDHPNSRYTAEGNYRLGLALMRMKKQDEAIGCFLAAAESADNDALQGSALSGLGRAHSGLKKYGEALQAFADAFALSTETEVKEELEGAIDTLIDKVPIDRLTQLAETYDNEYPGDAILFRIGSHAFDNKDWNRSAEFLKRLIDNFSRSRYLVETQNMLSEMAKLKQVDPQAIGVILPMTGKFSSFGEISLMGISLAAGIYEGRHEASGLRIIVEDSKGDPAEAVRAVDRLVIKNHVIAIIGPLFGRTAEAAATRAQTLGVPMICLSQKPGIPQLGDYIFRNSMTARMQARSIAEFAFTKLGATRFAILYPNDTYGDNMMNAFWDEVVARKGEIVGVEEYPPDEHDFGKQIERLTGISFLSPWRKAILKKKDELRPVVDFDAIYIPDSYRKVGLIAPQLRYHDVKRIVLLGTNLWNNQGLIKIGERFVRGSYFVDGFFPSPSNEQIGVFNQEFQLTFMRNPDTLAAQAYDTMGLLYYLVGKLGLKTREDLQRSIASQIDFPGVTGRISFDQDGEGMRNLFILTVEGDQIVDVVDK
jgi:ABC-type branched-subunit amino acid transport system substrate-binding protein/outer membrane protein assembly factor BamD (BamD/ComL family)